MVFLFEQIAVEAAMIIATLVATTCLLVVLLGFVLQRRAQRKRRCTAGPASTMRASLIVRTWRRRSRPLTTDRTDIQHPMGDIAYIVLVLIGFIAVYWYARFATRL